MGEFLSLAFYGAVVIAVLIASMGIAPIAKPFQKFCVHLMPALIAGGIGLEIIFSGRNVSLYGLTSAGISVGSAGIGLWVLRIATAAIVSCAVIVLINAINEKNSFQVKNNGLLFSFCFYIIFTYVISGLIGAETSLSYKVIYPIIIFVAAYMTCNDSLDNYLIYSRNVIALLLLTGITLIFIKPSLVVQQGYKGVLPFLHFRFWGITSHANNLGSVAIFYILLVRWKPYEKNSLNIFGITLALSSVLMAQSKTSFIAGFVAVGYLFLHSLFKKFDNHKTATLFMSFLFTLSGMLLTIVWYIYYNSSSTIHSLLFNGGLTNLTGRSKIWAITLDHWLRSPYFGYGPTMWGANFSYQYGYLGIASNAHNQIIDSLGMSGLMGLCSLLIYIGFLFGHSLRLNFQTEGVTLAFFLFFMVRCVSEVPFKLGNITTTDCLMHLIFFTALTRLSIPKKAS